MDHQLTPYWTVNNILEDLKDIYEDSDKPRNYRRAYNELIQETMRFSDFFIEFHRLSTFLGYRETQCMDDMQDKIVSHLQSTLASQMVQPTSLSTMKDYLIHLDNEQRAAKVTKDQKDTSLNTHTSGRTAKRVTFGITQLRPTTSSSGSGKIPIDPQRQTDEKDSNCYVCHQLSHITSDCLQ